MKLTALVALGVYLVWQAINTGIQIAGTFQRWLIQLTPEECKP